MSTMPSTPADKSKSGLDWSQWYWPGPTRAFSDAELARAGQQPWPRGLTGYLFIGAVIAAVPMIQLTPRGARVGVALCVLGFIALSIYIARLLWKKPSRNRLNWMGYAVSIPPSLLFVAVLAYAGIPKDRFRELVQFPLLIGLGAFSLAYLGWWAVVMLRVQQIEARLAELDEQERSVQLARRLATAQIQPHFLFNTLASVQHWVDTRDERAGPTLKSFTRYLRATLPMFERDTLSLAEELQIVRSYLEVMQARLGERLAWQIEADESAALSLPPGALLTLVENAIAHGIEPALRGGRVAVQIRCEAAGQWTLDVSNDGADLDPAACDGLGLANTRERLRQLFGERALLTLTPLTPGCRARIEIRP